MSEATQMPFGESNFGRYVLGLVEGGKMDLTLVHVLVHRSPEERIEYLKVLLFETVIPCLKRGEYQDELLLLYHINALDGAVRDKYCLGTGWDATAFDRDWTRQCREIYRLVASYVPADGKVSNVLLSVNVRWWFHTTDDQEAEEIFDFLIEATGREGVGADDVIQMMVRSELHDRVASRERLEKALIALGKENRWIRAHRLTKAISARWQRSLEPKRAISLAKVSQQFAEQLSLAEQEAITEFTTAVIKLGNLARKAIEVLEDDQLLHGLLWSIRWVDAKNCIVRISTEFTSREQNGSDFLGTAYAGDVLNHAISLFRGNKDFRHKAFEISVTFDGKEEVRAILPD